MGSGCERTPWLSMAHALLWPSPPTLRGTPAARFPAGCDRVQGFVSAEYLGHVPARRGDLHQVVPLVGEGDVLQARELQLAPQPGQQRRQRPLCRLQRRSLLGDANKLIFVAFNDDLQISNCISHSLLLSPFLLSLLICHLMDVWLTRQRDSFKGVCNSYAACFTTHMLTWPPESASRSLLGPATSARGFRTRRCSCRA